MPSSPLRALLLLLVLSASPALAQERVPLTSLDLSKLRQGWGEPQIDVSIEGKPLSIGGTAYATGLGSHAGSLLYVDLFGDTERFTAWIGIDDDTSGRGTVVFRVYGDGRKLFDSGVMTGGDPAKRIDVSLRGMKTAALVTTIAGDDDHHDHADWAEAYFHVRGRRPQAADPPREEKVLLTPSPGPEPRINGPMVQGVRPGRPFLYRIPCTGERPLGFAAEYLPPSLHLDSGTGIITGTAPETPGAHDVVLHAVNDHGTATRDFRIVVGEQLALTPPMGWNSWYIHYDRITQAGMQAAADAMVESGMADFGYRYVNIDDCWMKKKSDEPYRDADGAVLANAKFPDMAGLADYIHAKGLRAGLYISPGPWTCAGYVGSWEHEEIDACKFAEWGYDFLKYDWCSYGGVATGEGAERLQIPYRRMADILRTLDRDIVLNLCQYGMGEVWSWGGDVGGHCWRTTGDLGLQRGGLLPGFYAIGLANARHFEHARPGRWNDPDYILIGWVGSAHGMGVGEPTTLTGNEQYCYMSMWSLMAAPLVFSGDMAKLDEFTLNVLCNAEVIEVDQDPLGVQARIVTQTEEELVLAKPLADGSLAVGLFNLGEFPREMVASWEPLELEGKRRARDLWRQKDLGVFEDRLQLGIPRHGVAMLRLWPAE